MGNGFASEFARTTEAEPAELIVGLYGGKGTIAVRRVFRQARSPDPVLLAIYRLPPGTSEGVHSHGKDGASDGPLDEFYYFIAGNGEMRIGESRVAVSAGDYLFIPVGVPHGVENTSADADLLIHVIAIPRNGEAQ
jgi:oxalate decarboxylase/phosphoglucose isomerase-like protein (cupin superfamily)